MAIEAISVHGSGHGRKCGNVASAGRATSETRSKRSTSVTIFFFIPPAIFVGFVCFFIIDILIFLDWNVDWKSSCKNIGKEFRLTHLGYSHLQWRSLEENLTELSANCRSSAGSKTPGTKG
ncbi:hypothetical protein PYW08_012797 [Mythimna loreyi]|uniref:Uncharacterized protein n=1 Tax=Mythimna loreyi TaxID=667449 RepID=A0ACC2Q1D3_9NEOP|nr:hypothetical protein PYW08_012797 [Mythimna loreyi]